MESPHMHSVLTAAEVRRVLRTAKDMSVQRSVLKNLDPDGFSVFSVKLPFVTPNSHRVFMQMKMRNSTEPVTGYAHIPVSEWENLRQAAEVTADEHDEDEDWKQFQVDYPETSYNNFRIQVYEIEPRAKGRIDTIEREGADRDPGSGTFRKLVENNQEDDNGNDHVLWMSDTRAEILEHTPVLDRLEDAETLLVNGLGLGVVVHGALQFPNIKHVDVVELNHDLIHLIQPHLAKYGDRLTIHYGDAFDIKWPADAHWDLAWHDIWPMISDTNIPGMRKLMRKYKGKVAWQGCWQYQGSLKMYEMIQRMENGTLDPEEALQYILGYWKPGN